MFVCLQNRSGLFFAERVVRNFPQKQPECNQFDLCLLFFCLFETVCQCLEVLVCKCVFVCACWGPHVRNNDSYTPLGKNKHLKRPIYPLAGAFYKPHCSTFIHPLHFFPLHGITRWSGSAKNRLGAARREREQCV